MHLKNDATSKLKKANTRLTATIISTIIDHNLHGK